LVVAILCLAACRLNFDTDAGATMNGDGASAGDGVDPTGDGAVVAGTQVTLSTTGTCASVAWSGNRAGVVWREGMDPGDIRYATVNTAGTILDGPITIGSALANVGCPAIEWTGAQFLVAVASGSLNGRDVDVTAITGTSASVFVNVVTDSADSRSPSLVYAAPNAIVSWQSAQGANTDVWIRRVDAIGMSMTVPVIASGAASTNGPPDTVAANGELIAAWLGGGSMRMRSVAQANELAMPTLSSAGPLISAAASRGTDVVLTYVAATPGTTLYVGRVSTTGGVLSGPTPYAAAGIFNVDAAWTGTAFGVLYAENSGLVQTHLAQFDADGAFLGEAAVLNATTTSSVSLVWAGDRYVAAVDSNLGVNVKFFTLP
jgi:hypothetical protein